MVGEGETAGTIGGGVSSRHGVKATMIIFLLLLYCFIVLYCFIWLIPL